jgi:hypothetical protein
VLLELFERNRHLSILLYGVLHHADIHALVELVVL